MHSSFPELPALFLWKQELKMVLSLVLHLKRSYHKAWADTNCLLSWWIQHLVPYGVIFINMGVFAFVDETFFFKCEQFVKTFDFIVCFQLFLAHFCIYYFVYSFHLCFFNCNFFFLDLLCSFLCFSVAIDSCPSVSPAPHAHTSRLNHRCHLISPRPSAVCHCGSIPCSVFHHIVVVFPPYQPLCFVYFHN